MSDQGPKQPTGTESDGALADCPQLLRAIERETVPERLLDLALELQAALASRRVAVRAGSDAEAAAER